jgi:hypothetical protein
VGFNTPVTPPADAETPGGRARRPDPRANPFMTRPESADDATRLHVLTEEVRNPPKALTIADSGADVVVTFASGETRRFHATGASELVPLGDTTVNVTARRDRDQLQVLYDVEDGRQLRYTYSRTTAAPQLVVDVAFIGRGGGDTVHFVYEPPSAMTAASGTAQNQPTSFHPGDEFKNLTTVGVVVDELSQQATACGLTQSALESAITKRLKDGGLQVRRYEDQAPYLYVEVRTASVGNGLCVSRYDASLLTHTMATLNYQQTPALLEVSLLHEGGLTGGAPAAHAENVTHGLLQYVDQFLDRIKLANGR